MNHVIESLHAGAVIGALTAGFSIKEIEEYVPCDEVVDNETADTLVNLGKLIHMTNAAMAASLLDKFITQGFTREEAIPLIASILRK